MDINHKGSIFEYTFKSNIKMNDIKTFTRKDVELEIGSFDRDKEIEFCMSKDGNVKSATWLTANEINELINHLAKCLKSIREPIDLLEQTEL